MYVERISFDRNDENNIDKFLFHARCLLLFCFPFFVLQRCRMDSAWPTVVVVVVVAVSMILTAVVLAFLVVLIVEEDN